MNKLAYSMPLAVKAVVIDLDGTLIDSAPDLAASANRMLGKLGMPVHETEQVARWIGNGVSRLVKRALTGEMNAEPDPQLYEKGYALFLEAYADLVSDQSRPYPGVVAGLEKLQAAGFQLACITNKAEAFTGPLLQDLDLRKYFKLVLSGDTLPRKKPDPLPLLHACEYFGISPNHGALIGDSINDCQAARNAGMPVILVSYGYNRGQDVRELEPEAVIQSLEQATEYLTLYS